MRSTGISGRRMGSRAASSASCRAGRKQLHRHGLRYPLPAEALEARLLLSRDLYVDIAAPGPAHDGSSWASAYADLQQALSAATAGDRILIADGTYKPTITADRGASFVLKEGISLLGGCAGYGAANPDARDLALYPTILSGDIGTPGTNTDNSYHVLSATNITSATTLDGLRVTAGNANGDYLLNQNSGGGMYLTSSAPTLAHCTFSGNAAGRGDMIVDDGGAIYSRSYPGSVPTFTDCSFIGNSANGNGGAISGSVTLTNCTFVANSAVFRGGAVYGGSSLTNCAFYGNSAQDGGGMYISVASPTLINCIFSGNSAHDPYYPYNPGDRVTGSDEGSGGGIYNEGGSPVLINCTFAANTADAYGGAVFDDNGFGSVTNSIIWASGSTPFYSYHSGNPTVSYSIIQGGYSGRGSANTDGDPMFARSPWAGPDGRFGTADDDYGDLRLRSGSPALNSGYSQAVPADITTDLAGNSRIQGSAVDRGAYEGANSAPAAKTLYVDASATGTNTGGSWTDAFTSLQSALAAARDGDTIRIADGTYKPTPGTDRNATFTLRNNVVMYGSYAGDGAPNPDTRDTRLYPTILSGDIGTAGNRTDNSYHVVVGIALVPSVVLDGFTITAGSSATQNSGDYTCYGGGLLSLSSSPALNSCTFSGNSAYGGGGMMAFGTSIPTIAGGIFIGNSASYGGGIYAYTASPRLNSSSFLRNSAASDGGGIYMDGNRNTYPTHLTLANVSFLGNTANRGGGLSGYCEPTVADALFVGNSASQGGGVYAGTWNGTFSNCTFSGNIATGGPGGAIYNATPALANSILWGNGASPLYTPSIPPGGLVISRCDIEGSSIVGSLNADPQFVRTPSPGQDSTWGTADDDYGNLRLRYTSPCIDAGSNGSGNLSGILADLAGNPRFVDVPSVPDTGYGNKPLLDLGVYEMPATPDTTSPTLTTITINDGAAQRSMVKKVAVSFSEPMSLVPGALSVKLSSGLAVPNTTITLANPTNDQKSFVLAFSGPAAVGGSLADGIYDLLISAAGAQDLAGNTLTADYSQRFHRLFGDVDGNRVVNALDYAKLKATYGRSWTDPLFNPALDHNGDGVINALDLAQFRKRYGQLLSY